MKAAQKLSMLLMIFAFVLIAASLIYAEEPVQNTDSSGAIHKQESPATVKTPVVRVSPAPAAGMISGENFENVQRQLDDVIATNKRLQEDYLKRMEKIKQISSQARIHQKILDNIRSQSAPQNSAVEQAVRQEKIRIIAEQARKNYEMLKALRSNQQSSS